MKSTLVVQFHFAMGGSNIRKAQLMTAAGNSMSTRRMSWLNRLTRTPVSVSERKDIVAVRYKMLMDRGVDPMVEDDSQRTSLDIAAAMEQGGILKLFERNKFA